MGYSDHDVQELNGCVAFVGSAPNIGTTITALKAAMKVASQTTDDIMFICLNLKSSKLHRYLSVEHPPATLDEIRASLRSRSLHPEQLYRLCYVDKELPNLYFLFGNRLREQAEYFTPEDIEFLLETAMRRFKCCVIDVNAYWDNAATATGLLKASMKIMVTLNGLFHFQEDIEGWMNGAGSLLQLKPKHFHLIVNDSHPIGESDGFKLKAIERESGMRIVGRRAYDPHLMTQIYAGRLLNYILSETDMASDEMDETRLIMENAGLVQKIETLPPRTWLKKLIST